MSRILVSAAEASGDGLAAGLVRSLRAHGESLPVEGVAGPAMRAAGVKALVETESLSVMGIGELWGRLGAVLSARRTMLAALREGASLLVVVDAPDFNLPLARAAKAQGIPVVFYVSPQVWAWRSGRAREISALAETVLCLFDFEPAWYERWGGKAVWVGHPVAEKLEPEPGQGEGWAFLPGSRPQEIRRLLPTMLQVARKLREGDPGVPLRLSVAPGGRDTIEEVLAGEESISLNLVDGVEAAVRPSAGCLVCSGTATLEVACLGRPMVVVYAAHPVTWWLGRRLVRGVQHVALPNLVMAEPLVPEFLQDLDPDRLACALQKVVGDPGHRQGLLGVRERLGGEGATDRAAREVAEVL